MCYASIIWFPYTQKNIQLIESVQRRAARFVTNDYSSSTSVTNLLSDLGWKPLSHRRNKLRLLMFYKIIQHLININTDSLLIPKPSIHITRGHDMRFLQPSTRINAYLWVSPFTGLDYWTEHFSFFGQVCIYFNANLEAFLKKLLLYSCHILRRVIRMILITELPYCSMYLQQFY